MNILAIDVGGTYIKYGIYDMNSQTLGTTDKRETPMSGLEEFLQVITEIKEVAGDVNGVAMSMPGTIDSNSGFVYQGGTLQYNNRQNLAEQLRKKFGYPVTIENDARCAALAELWKGSLKGIQNALVLVIGTGIGGAIIQNGQIYKGSHLYAGEFSAIFTKDISKYGEDAVFGRQVSIPYFVERCSKKLGKKLEGPELFAMLEKGCPDLQEDFHKYLSNFALQLFNLQIAFDPEKIVIGGGISKNKFFVKNLEQYVESFYKKIPLQVVHSLGVCKFGNSANLLGAVRHYLGLNNMLGE